MADWITEAEALHRDCADGGCVVSRLIRELQQQRHRTAEFQTIAAGFANRAVAAEARLAAVEALADEWERDEAYACHNAGDCTRCVTYQGAVIRLRRAALAAPTDTTKEN